MGSGANDVTGKAIVGAGKRFEGASSATGGRGDSWPAVRTPLTWKQAQQEQLQVGHLQCAGSRTTQGSGLSPMKVDGSQPLAHCRQGRTRFWACSSTRQGQGNRDWGVGHVPDRDLPQGGRE